MLILKIIFLFLAVMYGIHNVFRAWYKQNIPSVTMILMTVGIVGFITLQFLIK